VVGAARYDRVNHISRQQKEVIDDVASTAENTVFAPGLVGRVRELFKIMRSTPIDKSHDSN